MSDEQQWSDRQLMLEAEVIVAGQFGVYPVFCLLQKIRDEMQAANAVLERALNSAQSYIDALNEDATTASQPASDGAAPAVGDGANAQEAPNDR